jgi:hypothetical protein
MNALIWYEAQQSNIQKNNNNNNNSLFSIPEIHQSGYRPCQ